MGQLTQGFVLSSAPSFPQRKAQQVLAFYPTNSISPWAIQSSTLDQYVDYKFPDLNDILYCMVNLRSDIGCSPAINYCGGRNGDK